MVVRPQRYGGSTTAIWPGFGQIFRPFSANRSTIHLKSAINLTQNLIAVAEPLRERTPKSDRLLVSYFNLPVLERNQMIIRMLVIFLVISLIPHGVYASDETEDYSLTISGGISLGAYEAGLNFTLLKLMKKNSDRLRLVGVTGASAGNVNAVMSAITWCRNDFPEELTDNIFWDTWIPIGMDTLFPGTKPVEEYMKLYDNAYAGIDYKGSLSPFSPLAGKYPSYEKSDGLLTRRATNFITGKLANSLTEVDVDANCALSLGITLTKADPAKVRILPEAAAKELNSQKFILPLMVKGEGGRISITNQQLPLPADSCEYNDCSHLKKNSDYLLTTSGLALRLPSVTGKNSDTISIEALLRAVKASAAFPVAFGPVDVYNCAGDFGAGKKRGSIEGKYYCPGQEVRSDRFIDGGAFDNIPVGLAALQLKNWKKTGGDVDEKKVTYIFMDPGRRRVGAGPETGAENKSSKGFEKFWINYVGDFVDSAADTELVNTVVRYPFFAKRLKISNRYSPLTGDYLMHFGAFFDRPFREYDYYAGVYDALWNIASHSCSPDAKNIGSGESMFECIGARMEAYSRYIKLPFGEEAKSSPNKDAGFVIRKLAISELAYREVKPWSWLSQLPATPQNGNIKKIMAVLFALDTRIGDRSGLNEKSGGSCAEGNSFENFVTCVLSQGYSGRNVAPGGSEYGMESSLDSARQNFSGGLKRFVMEATERLSYIEREDNAKSGEMVADTVRYAFRTLLDVEETYRANWNDSETWVMELDPSSVPDDESEWGEKLAHALPYRLGVNSSGGGMTIGYEPALWFHDSWSVRFPVEPLTNSNQDNASFLAVGALLNFETGFPGLSSVGVGGMRFHDWSKDYSEESWGARFRVGIASEKFSVSYTIRDAINEPWQSSYWMLSIDDMNGALYWLSTIFIQGGL